MVKIKPDTTALYQDVAKTTLATVENAPVGCAVNIGTGFDFTNTGATDRPLLKTVNGIKELYFDGSNDFLSSPVATVFDGTDKPISVFMLVKFPHVADANNRTLWGMSDGVINSFFLFQTNGINDEHKEK